MICICINGKISEKRCGPFPMVEHAQLISFNNSRGGKTVIRCDRSFRFSDGKKQKSFKCLSTLKWQRERYCYCEYNRYIYISIYQLYNPLRNNIDIIMNKLPCNGIDINDTRLLFGWRVHASKCQFHLITCDLDIFEMAMVKNWGSLFDMNEMVFERSHLWTLIGISLRHGPRFCSN